MTAPEPHPNTAGPTITDGHDLLQGTQPIPAALPHQPPFRWVDRLLHVDVPRGLLWALRHLTANDALWPAEAAQRAQPPLQALPSTFLIEALSQAAACFNIVSAPPSAEPHLGYLVSVTQFGFPAHANIGDTLLLCVEKQEALGAVVAFFGTALAAPPGTHWDALFAGRATWPAARDLDPPPDASPAATRLRKVGAGRLLFAVTSK